MSSPTFLDRLRSGQVLVADGATGTNLQQRGLPQGMPSETWLFDRPDEIVRLHLDLLHAGADILLTNTFGASPLRLEAAGMVSRVAEANRLAVELARQAISSFSSAPGGAETKGVASDPPQPQAGAMPGSRPIYLAGSLGPAGQLIKPLGPLDESQVYESYAAQARLLVEAGVDLLVIETQFDVREAELALQGARSVPTPPPVVVSFSYDRGVRTMMGVRPSQMAARFAVLGVDLLGINCGRSLEENLQVLQELRSAAGEKWLIWFKPNAGLPSVDAQGVTVYKVTPQEMGALVPDWIACGANVVGGCCGASPAHLAQIVSHTRRA